MQHPRLAGIDIGSKRGGTTVICFLEDDGQLDFLRCPRGMDPEDFLEEYLVFARVRVAFIDAPLSLPGVYCHPDRYDDYFFRQCDRALKGMSPMFIGGLTARAMRLRDHMRTRGVTLMETYPAGLFRMLFPEYEGSRKKAEALPVLVERLVQEYGLKLRQRPEDWHAMDALLAWMSAWRWAHGQAVVFGEPEEGIVFL